MFGRIDEDFEVGNRTNLKEFMDIALKNITKSLKSNGEGNFVFVMKANTPKINEYDIDVTYTISFGKPLGRTVFIDRPDIFGENGFYSKLLSSTLMFSNDVSHMSDLNKHMTSMGYPKSTVFNGIMVLSTIGRCFLDYLNSIPTSRVQGIDFITAGPHLVKPYIILSRTAEKNSGIISSRIIEYRKQGSESFQLISPEAVRLILEKIKSGKEN